VTEWQTKALYERWDLVDHFGWAAAALVPGWLLLVWWPVFARRRRELAAPAMGFLRRGERGALGTAVTALYADGLIVVSRRGLLQRGASPMRAGVEPFAAAVYAAMPAPTRIGALPARSRVRGAVATLVRDLSRAGLVPGRVRWLLARVVLLATAVVSGVRVLDPDLSWELRVPYAVALVLVVAAWWVPRRTVAGYRALRRLRREHADLLRAAGGDRSGAVDPDGAVIGYALAGVVPPGLAAGLARGRYQRPPDDYPGERDYDSGPGIVP
jgi:uncharacterized protein (TIGR04222 family)